MPLLCNILLCLEIFVILTVEKAFRMYYDIPAPLI